MTNCKVCTDGTTCTTCNDGFYYDTTGASPACTSCLANCKVCTDGTTCTTCNEGYEKKDNEGTITCELINTPEQCEIVGCKQCVAGDVTECETCYTDLGFVKKEKICQCNTASEYGFSSVPGGKKCECADKSQTITDGKCVSTASNCLVSNCDECESSDNTYCKKCKEGFGLRGGYCTKCFGDLYIGPDKPCQYDCSMIPNCKEFSSNDIENGWCTVENGEFYCIDCELPYIISNDHKSCILNSNQPTSCSSIPGCMECNDELECTKCNTEEHWSSNIKDGQCNCDTGYDQYNGQCLEIVPCDTESNCQKCLGPNKICIECADTFGLKGGKCDKCGEGLYAGNSIPCLITNCPDSNCDKCTNFDNSEQNICINCKTGYNPVNGKCINTTKVDCTCILGCTKCYAGDTSICAECNETENFKLSRVHTGTCVCTAHFDFVDNKCVRPTGPYSPPQVNLSDMFHIPDSEFNPQPVEDGAGTNYILKDDANVEGNKVYKEFKADAGAVTIPDKFKDKQYYFDINAVTNPFTVQIPDTTVADIVCNGASINLPPKNNNININGAGDLKLNPIGDANSLTVNTVTFQPNANEITLDSDKANITMLILDVFGDKSLTGQKNNGDKIYQTVCQLVKVEADSDFKAAYLKFDKIKVGLRSLIEIDDTNEVSGAPIELFHIAKGYGNQKAPLVFTGDTGPKKTGDIIITEFEEGKPVPSEQENFTVAEFKIKDNSKNESLDACLSLKDSFKGNDNFPTAECVKDEEDSTKYNLVATKNTNQNPPEDDDGGLSAGAIAGIVIACVVVVAAIIALLVYFLVIKKKNASTTSTQGDSSIAI